VLPTHDFPKTPQEQGKTSILSGEALKQAIEKTRYAISESNQKVVMQGALLTLKQNGAAMISTDGKRLAVATMRLDKENEELQVVIPSKTLDVLVTQLSDSEVTMTQSEKHLFFRIDNRLLISRMIDGKFPRYEAIIPRDNDKKVS
jgi:DNA polymerase-3 subunit beta